MRAPEPFTADPETAERTLHSLRTLRRARMLFGHGLELTDPCTELGASLEP